MGLMDTLTGGKNEEADSALLTALNNLSSVTAPTAEQLTLPQLAEYVQQGILTPDQAQTYTENNNAFDTTTADNAGMDTELSTIGDLKDIINKGGNDAEEQSQIQSVLNSLNTTESGNNAAVLRDAQSRGVANSGTTLAARLASNQNDATNANTNANNAAADAEARNLAAITAAGTLGGQVQGQQYTQDANKANAANAIEAFNAQQKQMVEDANTTANNAAKGANLEASQQVSNANTASKQQSQESAVTAQQQAFSDALEKAGAYTNAANTIGNQDLQEGEQQAGVIGGLTSTAGNIASSYFSNPYSTTTQTATPNTNVNTSASASEMAATGGRITDHGVDRPLNMKAGGPVPGEAMVPGDSPKNDTVLAHLSPEEIVLPRSVTTPTPDPSKVLQFLRSLPKPQPKVAPRPVSAVHPRAVLDTLRALSAHHQGVA